MDILPILVAMLVAVAAVIVAGVFYSKAKVSEQEAASWKLSSNQHPGTLSLP